MTQITDTLYCKIVPEGIAHWMQWPGQDRFVFLYDEYGNKVYSVECNFKAGSIYALSSITEDQAAGLVAIEDEIFGYRIYTDEYIEHESTTADALGIPKRQKLVSTSSAKHSLETLLQSKGIDTSKPETILLIKKKVK